MWRRILKNLGKYNCGAKRIQLHLRAMSLCDGGCYGLGPCLSHRRLNVLPGLWITQNSMFLLKEHHSLHTHNIKAQMSSQPKGIYSNNMKVDWFQGEVSSLNINHNENNIKRCIERCDLNAYYFSNNLKMLHLPHQKQTSIFFGWQPPLFLPIRGTVPVNAHYRVVIGSY